MSEVVNRRAVIVRHRPAFYEWWRQVESDADLAGGEVIDSEPTVYLLAIDEADVDGQLGLAANWRAIMRDQLEGWCEDRDLWPAPVSEELFDSWFEVESASLVLDLTEDPLARD
ncbi:MAG: hypothetical protein R3F20_02455 [Planctomycetota bacterium]